MENKVAVMQTDLTYIKTEMCEMKGNIKGLPNRDEMRLAIKEGVDEALKSASEKFPLKKDIFDEDGKPKFADKKEFGLVQKLVFIFYGILAMGTLTTVGYLIQQRLGVK